MPGANCSIFGCSSSRKSKGCSIFKLPASSNDFNKKWRGDLLNVIRKERVVDDILKRRIDADRLHICERHFSDYQFCFYATRKSLKEGAIPTLNLPQKPIPSITSPPHSTITITKHEESSATQVLSSSTLFYKDLLHFKQRVVKLQINDTWSINLQDNYAILTFLSGDTFCTKR